MNWDYIAGFFDGEGSVFFVTMKGRRYARVAITQNDRSVLEEIQAFLTDQGYDVRTTTSRHSPMATTEHTELKINAQADVRRFLEALAPLCLVKQAGISKALAELRGKDPGGLIG